MIQGIFKEKHRASHTEFLCEEMLTDRPPIAQISLEFIVELKMTLNSFSPCLCPLSVGSQACATTPGECGSGEVTQDFLHTIQALSQLSYIPIPEYTYF